MSHTTQEIMARYGEARPSREPLHATAGPVRFVVEDGMIKHVRLNEVELVRRVYFAVRDDTWDTIYPVFSNIQTQANENTFRMTFDAECKADHVHYRWQGTIQGDADGTITFRAEGEPVADFQSNRIGLCLLLPADSLKGAPFTMVYTDGSESTKEFPCRIDHDLVGAQFQSIRYRTSDDTEVTCIIEGATFDMEDQRLYMDTTYKAYAPLPHAYTAAKVGERFTQTFTLRTKPAQAPRPSAPIVVKLGDQPTGVLPKLGLTLNVMTGEDAPIETEQQMLADARLAHLRVEIDLNDEGQASETLTAATPIVARVTDTLLLAVHNLTTERVDTLRQMLDTLSVSEIKRILLETCDASPDLLPKLQTLKTIANLTVEIGGPGPAGVSGLSQAIEWAKSNADFVTWAGSPAVHQEDDETLMENTYGIFEQLNDIRQERSGVVLARGPFRLDGAWPRPHPSPRYAGQFAAAWLASAVHHLTAGAASFATLFNITGPEGVFPRGSTTRAAHSSWAIIPWLAQLAGRTIRNTTTSYPLCVEALTVHDANSIQTLIVNKTFAPQEIQIQGLPCSAKVRMYDPQGESAGAPFPNPPIATWTEADTTPMLSLAPYQIALLSSKG